MMRAEEEEAKNRQTDVPVSAEKVSVADSAIAVIPDTGDCKKFSPTETRAARVSCRLRVALKTKDRKAGSKLLCARFQKKSQSDSGSNEVRRKRINRQFERHEREIETEIFLIVMHETQQAT